MHIGHLAGADRPADIFARYHRLIGNRVLMVSGSDSHGTPVLLTADAEGKEPRAVFEHYHERLLRAQQQIGISYDLYTHTDTENHWQVSQDIFMRLYEQEYLYREIQKQLYSETENRFLPDRYVEGTCPHCGYNEARGDQCDNCGQILDAIELIDPRSKIDGSKPVVRETEHFFFDLPAFTDALLDYIGDDKEHWRANVTNFTRNFIEGGLKGRPITRDIDWGINVPLPGFEDKRIYVWFEAVIGYLSASVEWAKITGQPEAWKDWWYKDEAKVYNFIGKDNIVFHTVMWPAELMGIDGFYRDDDEPINLPYDVPANEFMNIEGRQFSKSRNWAIWLYDILERYDPDAIRYYVASSFPETRDTDFDWAEFVAHNNNELVATWGNLVNRMLGFARKHFGTVPDPGELRPEDEAIIAEVEAGFETIGALIGRVKLRQALDQTMALAQAANRYLDERAPWFEIKEDKAQAAKSVYTVLRVIDNLKVLFAPFLPFSSENLHGYLGYDAPLFGTLDAQPFAEETREHLALTYDGSAAAGRWEPSALPVGQEIRKPKPLYQKLDESVIEDERSRLGK